MNKQKVVIFESVKWAWKSSTLNWLSLILENFLIFGEDITLQPIKHNNDKLIDINYYKKVIQKIKDSNNWIVLLDRFHFTKWPIDNFDSSYFREIEEILLQEFDPYLVFFYVNPDILLERLNYTNIQRSKNWWKLNYDWSSIQQEAQKDIEWQNIFIEKVMKSTLIPNSILDTSKLHIWDFGSNSRLIVEEVIKIIS